MEAAIRDNDYVLVVCTPTYKRKSDDREGGVGYEGGIIAGEMFINRPRNKFIPILRNGQWRDAAPTNLTSRYYIDLRGDSYNEASYTELVATLTATREQPPKLGGSRAASARQRLHLRGQAIDLSLAGAKQMLQDRDFPHAIHNPRGRGIKHDYRVCDDGQTVQDRSTGLRWRRATSAPVAFDAAQLHIQELNSARFAQSDHWRLPTLEETMSLMEPEEIDGLWIDRTFHGRPWVWTCDRWNGSVWCVYFNSMTYAPINPVALYHTMAVREDDSGE